MTYRQATRLFVTCMAVLCFVSFYTSKVGYQTTTKDAIIYWGMAFGGALFQFSTFWFLAEYFARGSRTERVRYGAIAGAICVLVFWFSTQWSVVSMGGKDAVSTHMQRTLAAAEMQGLRLYRRAATEANLGPQLQTLSQNFTDLARREAGGAFSGLQGEGDVVATLRNTSQLFANLAASVQGADKESRQDYDRARDLIGQARASAARMEGADISDGEEVRKNNLEFAKHLGDINAVMARMAQTSSVGFIREVNRNLTSLTMSAKADDQPVQEGGRRAAQNARRRRANGHQPDHQRRGWRRHERGDLHDALHPGRHLEVLARHPLRLGGRHHARLRAAVLHDPAGDRVRPPESGINGTQCPPSSGPGEVQLKQLRSGAKAPESPQPRGSIDRRSARHR